MPAINQASEMSQKSVARVLEPAPKFRLTDAVREQMLPPDSGPKRIFLLSPANIAGIRAAQVMSGHARSDLAIRLRDGGAPLGEVFSFISGLYFRGKLAYARAFAEVPPAIPGAFVITAGGGLIPPEAVLTLEQLREISAAAVDTANASYRRPLDRDSRILFELAETDCQIVLLGSIATPKYVDPLLEIFGERLFFPAEFAGRGDMSRGGLMLRCVSAGVQLTYVPFASAARHGSKPPKLVALARRKLNSPDHRPLARA
jgi:hypothetical protein